MKNSIFHSITKPSCKVGPIGLEFAHEGVNAVQLQLHSSGDLSVKDSRSIPYPKDFDVLAFSTKGVKKIITSIFEHSNFLGRVINTAMPTRELRIISVNYQPQKNQSDALAIANAVNERIDGDIQDHIVDYLPVRKDDKNDNGTAIVALANKEKVINYLECLRKSKLNVTGLEIAPSAIRRLISSIHKPANSETVLVVNFGSQSSFISIISGRRLLFDESIEIGEEALLSQLQSSLKLDKKMVKSQLEKHGLGRISNNEASDHVTIDENISNTLEQILKPEFQKISHSIKRSALYASSITYGQGLKKIYLLGSLARWRGSVRIFSELLNMEIQLISDPLQELTSKSTILNTPHSGSATLHSTNPGFQVRPELAVAAGLALQGIQEHG